MYFYNETERLADPQARLIAGSILMSDFCYALSDRHLALMTTPWESIRARLTELKMHTIGEKLRSWDCITLSHPLMSIDELTFLAKQLDISSWVQLRTAVHVGRMDMFDKLIPGTDPANYLFFLNAAAESGHLQIFNKLLELGGPELLGKVKADDEYVVFKRAARYGQLHIINRVIEVAPDEVLNMIKANRYFAFRCAAQNGHLSIINKLIELVPAAEVRNMIRANEDAAFCWAARNGHLPVINRLLQATSDDVLNMICHSFDQQLSRSVVDQLLSFYPIMALAEWFEPHNRFTYPHITATLASLKSQRQAVEAANAHAVFNLTDDNDAKCCFYILRNLIRRNDPALLDDIRFLLNIPAVKALAHQEVSEGQPNELLRMALSIGNRAAAEILFTIPAVRALAATHDYYRDEAHAGIDVVILARNYESSMHALTTGESQRLSASIARYKPIMDAEGVEPLFTRLLDTLKERYAANPAKITKDDGSELVLPLEWAAFTAIPASDSERQRALKAYYQQKDHTALRYLSQPNHWMNLHASYVNINDARTERWSTFAEHKQLIAMLWLAAKDATIPPTEGHTLASRIDHFVAELALIARAHNWDTSRPRADGRGIEEYDDLTGDKPSCNSGVKRRLFQSVVGHPLLRILTADEVKQEVSDFIRNKFIAHITIENRAALLEVWNKLIALDTDDAEPLKVLNITPAERTEFKVYMSAKYGAQFDNEPAYTSLMLQLCPEDKIHAQACDGLFDFAKLLAPPPVAAPPHGFFSPASAETAEEDNENDSLLGKRKRVNAGAGAMDEDDDNFAPTSAKHRRA